jgi:hypothetical protein
MANLSDFEKLLPDLSPGEKAQLLKWVVRDLSNAFPGIDSRPDVCGGEACIVRTRIHEAVTGVTQTQNQLLRVNRPN